MFIDPNLIHQTDPDIYELALLEARKQAEQSRVIDSEKWSMRCRGRNL